MRNVVWVVILNVCLIQSGLSDERYSPVFPRRVYHWDDGPAFGQIGTSVVVDMIGGGVILYNGVAFFSQSQSTGQSYQAAKNELLRLETALSRDPRLSRVFEVRKLIKELQPFVRLMKSCEGQVASLTYELEQLMRGRGPGDKTEDEWYLQIDAARDTVNQTLRAHRIRVGVATGFLTIGGLLVLQVGTRLWVWNYHRADPGLFPNVALTYRYGVKPVFRLVGVVDTVENLFLGPDGKPIDY